MSYEVRNENFQNASKVEAKFIQFSSDSIELIADSAGHPNLSKLVANNLAEDTSYRIRELIQTCGQILRHSKRSKLTKEDVDLAFKWSDIPQIHGLNADSIEFVHIHEQDIYHLPDNLVDLTKDYPFEKDVEVYSPMKLSIQYLGSESEDKLKTEVYSLYYEKISQSLLSTIDSVVEMALCNLSENPKLQPLLPTFSVFIRNLIGLSYENCHIVKRIPQIFNAIIKNPYLNIEPEQQSFTELLQYLLLNHADEAMSKETYELTITISQLLCQIHRRRFIPDLVETMTNTVTSENAKLTVQCRALIVLTCLSSKLLDAATKNSLGIILLKYSESSVYHSNVYLGESILAAIEAVLRYKSTLIEQFEDPNDPRHKQVIKEVCELYRLGYKVFDCSALRLRCHSHSLTIRLQKLSVEKPIGAPNELYWTIKPKRRPSPREKWQFCQNECYSSFSQTTLLTEVFDYSSATCLRPERITFRVRNWKQKPAQSLKKKTFTSPVGLESEFSLLSKSSLRPISKCSFSHSTASFINPIDMIL